MSIKNKKDSATEVVPLDALHRAHVLRQKKEYIQAAQLYLKYALDHEQDMQRKAGHLLHAAQCFELQHHVHDAAQYYLKASECYVDACYLHHSFSALKAYVRVNHHKEPLQPILHRLMKHDFWHSVMLDWLPEEESWFEQLVRGKGFKHTIFKNLHRYDLFQKAMKWMKACHVKRSQSIAVCGEPSDSIYFIVSGIVKAHEDDTKQTVAYFEDMDMFGDAEFFLDHRWTMNFVAHTDVRLIRVPYEHFSQLKLYCPQLNSVMDRSYCRYMVLRQLAVAPIFSTLPVEDRMELSTSVVFAHVLKGECLFHEDEVATHVYIIFSGKLVARLRIHHQDRVFKELGVNQVVGEVAVVNQKRRTATVIAVENSCLLCIPEHIFCVFCEKHESLCQLLEQRKWAQLKEVQQFMRRVGQEKTSLVPLS